MITIPSVIRVFLLVLALLIVLGAALILWLLVRTRCLIRHQRPFPPVIESRAQRRLRKVREADHDRDATEVIPRVED